MARASLIQSTVSHDPWATFCTIITMLCSMGFPGNFETLMPKSLSVVVLYGPFAFQIAVMLLASGKNIMDIKLVSLEKKYVTVYIMLVVWFAVSMKSTSFPKEQVIACVRFSVTALFALWIVDKYDVHEILLMTYFAELAMLFFTLAGLVLMPGRSFSYEAGERTFCGLYTTKNSCAGELSFGLGMQAVLYKDYRQRKLHLPPYFWLSLGLHFFFLLLCKATGALFCAAIPVAYLFLFTKNDKTSLRLPLGMIHVAGSVGFLVVALTILPLFKPFFDMIGKDVTLTNRTPMWEQMIKVMSNNHTMTGFGFTMFWKDSLAVKLFHNGFRRDSWGNTMTYGAHNSLIEIWMDVGLTGMAAYFLMVMVSMKNVNRLEPRQYDFVCMYMLWQTIRGLTERSYIPFNYQTLYLFLAVGIACGGTPNHAAHPYRPYAPRSDLIT